MERSPRSRVILPSEPPPLLADLRLAPPSDRAGLFRGCPLEESSRSLVNSERPKARRLG